MSDILVEIPDHDLPKVALLYKEQAPWAPHMVSLVHSGIKWKKSSKYRNFIQFFSPLNCWSDDGTIIVIIKMYTSRDIIVFTLDDKCTNLYKGLIQSNLILLEKGIRTHFFGLHEKHIPTVQKYITEKKINVAQDIRCFIYAISPDEGKKFTTECPSDVYIKKLDPSDAKQINDVWPHQFPNSQQCLAGYIEINGGYGIFLKSTNEMVAWVIKHAFGHLALLQTKEEHKRKGYASLVTKVLAKEIAEEEHWPLGTILLNNQKSIAMFEQLGFRNIGICTFIVFETL